MGVDETATGPVENPTWMADIRYFFRPVDIQHMGGMGIDLATYAGVKKDSLLIYYQTAPPNPSMPPDQGGKWSADKSQTFRNWIQNGCPLGTATAQPTDTTVAAEDAPERVRRNIASLSSDELETLKTAFLGLMERDSDPSNDLSYFAIAGQHGLPGSWCAHHEDRFNPWHRAYLKVFEDQLRSIPGCESVTLPYWDISTPIPDVLNEAPFASYDLPRDPGLTSDPPLPNVYFPYTTSRFPWSQIEDNLQQYDVLGDIAASMQQSLWGAFNTNGYQDYSIQAHDGGHGSIGDTMGDQNVASYDPIFWFFHCNLDRLWLQWQVKVGATTLDGFKSTLSGNVGWLVAPFNAIPPFDGTTANDTIAFGIGYDDVQPQPEAVELENSVGSVEAARSFKIKRETPVSVRVKDIDRLGIPGSFVVKLLADGEPIAKRFFFQPHRPQDCENCRRNALVNIDFRIDQEELVDRNLSVELEVPSRTEEGTEFPLTRAGNPTINARLLLEDQ